MEPQSSPPAPPPTPAPAPGSNADILVDDSVSNAPATRPASVAATSAMTDSQETEESSSVATSKKRKLTSQVWDHFEKIIQDGIAKAVCNYCQTQLAGASSTGTTHLKRHADKCIVKHGGIGSSRQSQIDFRSGSQAVWVFSQEVTQKKIAEMIILHEYPFAMVEHQGFQDMMASAQSSLVIPGRKTLQNDCIGLYNSIKEIKMAQLTHASYIALTTDLWTSTNLMDYMVVLSKLRFITLDNASSNNLAVTRLKQFVTDRTRNANPQLTPANSGYFHVRCLAHVINLVVKEGITKVNNAMHRLRESVLYIHGSAGRLEAFNHALVASSLNPKIRHPSKDVPTRWNASYLMIESSLPCNLAFQNLEMKDEKFQTCPSEADWDELVAMKTFLDPFYNATQKLSGTKYPTLNLGYRAMRKIEKAIDHYAKSNA
ncbi:hypothetical protein PCASD_04726 [Puccinia coronata f. sp. avenae]|uniref:BED-type domain-containing protein n=1 Tax=Puccinia coronata f. sp. avenae TaxID=200324 RepID=A0A2N5UZA8_9BASI|nr:hypothetical protein PCASD_04726 [Puccinia coronata f. sp. avenae]